MKSKVFFVPVTDADDFEAVNHELATLLNGSGILGGLAEGDRVAVKTHFGEEGNKGFVRPSHVRLICDGILARGASARLSDTNTLYRGRRLNSSDHRALAYDHGFTKEAVGVDLMIPDDTRAEERAEIPVGLPHIKTAKVARFFVEQDALVAISHFKGHILTGFGGALKNVGMGCATREGKLAQHCDVSPLVYEEKCIGCGACENVCPADAIAIVNKISKIDGEKCIGCASCLAACPTSAMFIDLEEGDRLQERMAEYGYAVLKKIRKKIFINFALRINQECDCWSMENPRIAPDVGIFASLDPVSIDKACLDKVNKTCGRDIFREIHPRQDGMKHLLHAASLGLGRLDYDLIAL